MNGPPRDFWIIVAYGIAAFLTFAGIGLAYLGCSATSNTVC